MQVDLGSILTSAQEMDSASGEVGGGVVGMIVLDDRGLLVASEGDCPTCRQSII